MKDMEDLGYIPEAVNNWIALMGWSYDDKTEFFTLDDLVEKFSLEKLNPSPAAINFSKLDHFNGLHIRNLDQADFAARIKPWFEKAGYAPEDDALYPGRRSHPKPHQKTHRSCRYGRVLLPRRMLKFHWRES